MSLYANINLPKAEEEKKAPVPPRPPPPRGKASKSASLYATVLATIEPASTAQQQPGPNQHSQASTTAPSATEPEKPTSALQFKPTIRKIQKPPKPKSTHAPATAPQIAAQSTTNSNKSFLQDVSRLQEDIANDDVNGFYRTKEGQKLARKAARKKKRKNEGGYTWTWDDDYDLLHPNDYEAYVDSDEQLREQIEWRRRLAGKPEEEEEEEEEEDVGFRGFAPPREYEYFGEEELEVEEGVEEQEDEGEYIPEPVAELDVEESGEDAYARRLRMAREAGMNVRPRTPSPPPIENVDGQEIEETPDEPIRMYRPDHAPRPPPSQPLPPPPQLQSTVQPAYPAYTTPYYQPTSYYDDAPGKTHPPSQPIPPSTTLSSEPIHYTAPSTSTISSEPVHYATPTASSEPVHYDLPEKTSAPGQRHFAARLMSKYGWEKGQSLGSSQTGLVTPLIARPDRQKKGTGTILNRNKRREDYGEQGKMSRCVVLGNVVDPGEVDEELVDEIGGECREKYGEVERMRVVEGEGDVVKVFVLFTSELSALRGVNGLNGRLFGGRTIKAAFYDEDKFEAGDFK